MLTKQSVLDGVPRELPGLMKALKLQKKAATVGFDWTELEDVLLKWKRSSLSCAKRLLWRSEEGAQERRDELGDVLFSIVNVARFLKIDPEEALALTNGNLCKDFHILRNSYV